jgi:hypothetical protein
MRRTQRAIAFAATAASLMVASAVTFAAGSAADETAVRADAAREAAIVRALDLQGGVKAMDLILPPAAEGAADNEVFDQGTQGGGGLPADRILPDVVRVPDNLASNAYR